MVKVIILTLIYPERAGNIIDKYLFQGGDQEAAQEANKYQEQEDNYSFVWQNKDKKTS